MPREITCAYDECCTWTSTSPNQRYCPAHRCKRRAENAAKALDDAELFEQPREFEVLEIGDLPDGYRVTIVGDQQIPFQDKATLQAIDKFQADFQPDLEIYGGGTPDFYSISSFDKNPSRLFNLQKEIDLGRAYFEARCTENPGARKILVEGNHEDRLRTFLWKKGPELAGLRALALEELLDLPAMGIERINYRSIVDILGFRVEHGYLAPGSNTAYPMNVSRAMATKTGSSGLCGHTHRFSVYCWTDSRGTHSYIENGCTCLSMEYAAFPNWQQAFTYGVVNKGKLHLNPTQIYESGFVANGEFYPRVTRKRRAA